MEVTVIKSGDSAIVPLPHSLVKKYTLRAGNRVNIRTSGGKIFISLILKKKS